MIITAIMQNVIQGFYKHSLNQNFDTIWLMEFLYELTGSSVAIFT